MVRSTASAPAALPTLHSCPFGQRGDTIDFVVGFGADGNYGYDATGLDATITPLTTDTLATYTTSDLLAGTHTITAVYNGDTNFSDNTSSSLTQTVLLGKDNDGDHVIEPINLRSERHIHGHG